MNPHKIKFLVSGIPFASGYPPPNQEDCSLSLLFETNRATGGPFQAMHIASFLPTSLQASSNHPPKNRQHTEPVI